MTRLDDTIGILAVVGYVSGILWLLWKAWKAQPKEKDGKMRYKIIKPVPGGDQWYTIADTESEVMPNFGVVSVSNTIPTAHDIAETCLSILIAKEKKSE